MRTAALGLATLSLTALPALGEAPKVVVDIAPVHSLVAQVMQGVGTPELIVPPGASPHHYSMRPSQSGLLAEAGLIVQVGGGYTPWLDEVEAALAVNTPRLELLELDGTARLPLREVAVFGEASHDDHAHDGGDHEDDHADDDHDHDHDHEGLIADPHAWLAPGNAAEWLEQIARTLGEADPENAETYAVNAATAQAALEELDAEITALVTPARGKPFVVLHDAYQYFGAHYGIDAVGAISGGDAATPGPRRIDQIRNAIRASEAQCVFAEPQQDTKLINLAAEGVDARVARLDPLGAEIELGPDHYAQTLTALAQSLTDCLTAD